VSPLAAVLPRLEHLEQILLSDNRLGDEVGCVVKYTETHCNALQRTATRCNTLQHAATRCNTLQYTATQSNTLQRVANTRIYM